MGATEVVDPAAEDAFDAWQRAGGGRSLVAFEAIGVPGIINSVLKDAPHSTRLVVVGVCMGDDTINPFFGISKELARKSVVSGKSVAVREDQGGGRSIKKKK